ncbi:MAG: site-specific DNA-methyltransferase [Actinobacteria bacterium]|nr:MAG: site-specific DNA-methyltransferase [Actinomycetota bacterium]
MKTTVKQSLQKKPSLKHFYQNKGIQLIIGNCLKEMPLLKASSIDLIFADPPYNLSNGGITCHAGRMVSVNKGDWDKSNGHDADFKFHKQWLKECQRLLTPNGTIWVSGTHHVIYRVGFAMQELGFKILNEISWFKPNAAPNLSCRYFTHSHESIIWAAKNKNSRHYYDYQQMKLENDGKQMRSVWTIPTPKPYEKTFGKHPTQKPLKLLDRIIRASSEPGSQILDPFVGSGTTAVAAKKLGRKCIGIDQSKEYLELAKKRLQG